VEPRAADVDSSPAAPGKRPSQGLEVIFVAPIPLFILHLPAPDFVSRVAVLLARLGSNVAAPTAAVLVMFLPVVVTLTVNDRLSVAFRFSVDTVQLSVPVELTGSGVHVHGPGATLTNFVPFGMASFSNNCFA
jgi:hypothetical protein